ncbi:MAG: hypothetical protein ACRCTI_09290, partial [Beijerinckiaceae bacterium]
MTLPKACALVIAAGLSAMPGPASSESATAAVQRFGNWIVGCDNRAECTAVGLSGQPPDMPTPDDGRIRISVRIGVDAASTTGFRFEIIVGPDMAAQTRRIVVSCLLCGGGL